MSKENEKLLYDFLNIPLDSGDEIFERFATLDGAVSGKGKNPLPAEMGNAIYDQIEEMMTIGLLM